MMPSEEIIQETREAMGLNRPMLVQYFDWLKNCLKGDFGTSYAYHKPVAALLLDRLWPTLKLSISSMFLMLLVHMGSYTVIGVTMSLKPWFVLFPGAITSRLMCPVLGILPNGLLAVEGQMTYFPEIMESENLLAGVTAALLWFLLFWWGSRTYFERQVSGK